MTPIERGTYALFALATPNDGDQTVEVFHVIDSSDHIDALAPGYYWQQTPQMPGDHGIQPGDCFDSDTAALNDARAFYGC